MTDHCNCEACGNGITRRMYYNGLRLKGIALCLVCQCVKNIVDLGEEKAKFFNNTLIAQFGVTQEEIEAKRKIPYWSNDNK